MTVTYEVTPYLLKLSITQLLAFGYKPTKKKILENARSILYGCGESHTGDCFAEYGVDVDEVLAIYDTMFIKK